MTVNFSIKLGNHRIKATSFEMIGNEDGDYTETQSVRYYGPNTDISFSFWKGKSVLLEEVDLEETKGPPASKLAKDYKEKYDNGTDGET